MSQYRMGSFEQTKIQFPTKNGDVDFEVMEKFISAIQKMVVRDVVKRVERRK